jgi:hypothetical protein
MDLHPKLQATIDALVADGCRVQLFSEIEALGLPDVVCHKNGVNRVFRLVPNSEASSTVPGVTFPTTADEDQWDQWFGATVKTTPQGAISLLNAASVPATEETLTPPTGMVSGTALTILSGGSTTSQISPGVWVTDTADFRAQLGGPTVSSAELWFKWNSDSTLTVPLGDGSYRKQIGIEFRYPNPCNVLAVMWHMNPNDGVEVSTKINAGQTTIGECGTSGYSFPTATTSSVPPLPTDKKWHRLRVDLIGTVMTVTCDGVIRWQGVIPSGGLAISGPPGVRADNSNFDFIFWTPLVVDSGITRTRVWAAPQANRPRYRISTTTYALTYTGFEDTYGQFVTYGRVITAGTMDRLQLVDEPGFNGLAFRVGPKPGDLQNNGVRSSIGGTWQDNITRYKKAMFAYQGDKTLDKFKVKFPTAGFPLDTAHTPNSPGQFFGLFWQWHQDDVVPPGNPTSPPIELLFRQHPTTGIWWLLIRYNNATYTVGVTGPGVPWTVPMVFDTVLGFEVEVKHSTIATGTDARRGGPGYIKVKYNGVEVANVAEAATIYPGTVFNHCDGGQYHGRYIDKPLYHFIGDWEHYVVPGAPIPAAAGQDAVITNPLYPYYSPP